MDDSLLATLWVDSVASGDLTVQIYTLTDTGKEFLLFTFPVVSAGTTNLLLKRASVSMQRFRIVATYTGACSYEIYVKAISGGGTGSSKILGASGWSVDQVDITPTPSLLIASALVDRAGILIKNWNATGNVFVAESTAKLLAGKGYPLAGRDALSMDIDSGNAVYAVADVATVDVRIVQAGG